jgi:hypothetical protein
MRASYAFLRGCSSGAMRTVVYKMREPYDTRLFSLTYGGMLRLIDGMLKWPFRDGQATAVVGNIADSHAGHRKRALAAIHRIDLARFDVWDLLFLRHESERYLDSETLKLVDELCARDIAITTAPREIMSQDEAPGICEWWIASSTIDWVSPTYFAVFHAIERRMVAYLGIPRNELIISLFDAAGNVITGPSDDCYGSYLVRRRVRMPSPP